MYLIYEILVCIAIKKYLIGTTMKKSQVNEKYMVFIYI